MIFAASLGCVSDRKQKAPALLPDLAPAFIDEINLLAIPVALNLDDKAGLDGFVIKIYATNRKRPKPLPIENGTLEVLMFDGIPGVTADSSPEPRRVWSYSAEDLKQHEIHTSIGTGYQIAPLWGDARPAKNKISVVARYKARQGGTVTSAPSIIAVALK